MEVDEWRSNLDKVVESLESFVVDIPLILAEISAHDNRLDLDVTGPSVMHSPDMSISNNIVPGALTLPVAVEQQING